MAGINYPLWYNLKRNVKFYLEMVATEETIIDPGRNYLVTQDRWRPWIEAQQLIPLVNVMVKNVNPDAARSGSRTNSLDVVSLTIDMYALGKAGETLPADELSALRLDLLVSQTREALTRLKENDLGFKPSEPVDPYNPTGPTWADVYGSETGFLIDRSLNFNLTYYDQENEQSTGQYSPARWDFAPSLPFIPVDNNLYRNLEELNLSVKDETLELFAAQFIYNFS